MVKKMSSVSAIIPTWNRADLLESILSNLRTQTRPPEQIIVVDNGSTDATQIVARQFGVDLIVFPENRGFAVAVNEGIRPATGEWILIINNDVVLEPHWIERLLHNMTHVRADEKRGFAVVPPPSSFPRVASPWLLIGAEGCTGLLAR